MGFLDDPANQAMLNRLRGGFRTPQDIGFFMHELKESAVIRRLQSIRDPLERARTAHLQTLEWQKIPYRPGYESNL